ncbi:hypothetical protein G8767_17230 [Rhodococcus sp. IC4_135]|uniref:hypothetical protein n=1 Tax=Rhodococcus sp. IC4_135 TaxID=2715537 RepID=UPI00141FB0C4|nr:hypothetical protein [Rhodococcus sp. IC4_135]
MTWLAVNDKFPDAPLEQQIAETNHVVEQLARTHVPNDFAKIQKFNRDGEPITLEEWAGLLSDRDYSTVGNDYATIDGGRVLVTTLWIGHRWAGGDLFTTRLLPMRGCNDEHGQQRPVWAQSYPTLAAAAGGHAEILDGLRAGRWPT